MNLKVLGSKIDLCTEKKNLFVVHLKFIIFFEPKKSSKKYSTDKKYIFSKNEFRTIITVEYTILTVIILYTMIKRPPNRYPLERTLNHASRSHPVF